MTWVAVGVGGASLVGSLVASNSASKQDKKQDAANQRALDVADKQFGLDQARDQRAQQTEGINNAMLMRRQRSADQAFNSLSRSLMSFDTNTGVAAATSGIEGQAGVTRRSLRNDLGGGVVTARSNALGLATRRARVQATNQIMSGNVAYKNNAMATLANPVMLQTPGSTTTGQASGMISGIYGNQANQAANMANAYRSASGQLAGTGAQILMNSYLSRTPAPVNPASPYADPNYGGVAPMSNAGPTGYGVGGNMDFNNW
jgi:hypothetical protein